MTDELIIQTESLTKRYGDITALNSLNLRVARNSIQTKLAIWLDPLAHSEATCCERPAERL
jgi:hypothetical protein